MNRWVLAVDDQLPSFFDRKPQEFYEEGVVAFEGKFMGFKSRVFVSAYQSTTWGLNEVPQERALALLRKAGGVDADVETLRAAWDDETNPDTEGEDNG